MHRHHVATSATACPCPLPLLLRNSGPHKTYEITHTHRAQLRSATQVMTLNRPPNHTPLLSFPLLSSHRSPPIDVTDAALGQPFQHLGQLTTFHGIVEFLHMHVENICIKVVAIQTLHLIYFVLRLYGQSVRGRKGGGGHTPNTMPSTHVSWG